MIIRVGFLDNDYRSVIEDACVAIMRDISQGYSGKESIELFEKYLDKFGLEDLRKRIVLGATGFCIARKGIRGWLVKNQNKSARLDLANFNDTIDYLDEVVKVEMVRNYKQDDDNGETCYIDLYQKKVFVC